MKYQAEYIWIDGTEPTRQLRSKTKIVNVGEKPPVWGFDGSSTNQATGHFSDCVLKPVFTVPDPLRGANDVLVMCEVLNADMTPHVTNERAATAEVAKKFASFEPKFGIEQEYTFFQDGRPYGWPEDGFPAPQGPYYCGVGGAKMPGRDIVEAHTLACIRAGIGIEGTNAEVMMGQWEFQVGVLGTGRDRRPTLARALDPRAHRRGVRRRRQLRRQAREGRLERRRGAHQLLHEADARDRWLRRRRRGGRVTRARA